MIMINKQDLFYNSKIYSNDNEWNPYALYYLLAESLKEEKSERDSIQSMSSLSSFAVNNVTLTRTGTHSSLGIRTSTLLTSASKPLPRSVSTGYENSPPPSVITVQFVNNGADSNGSLSDIEGASTSTASPNKESEGDKHK